MYLYHVIVIVLARNVVLKKVTDGWGKDSEPNLIYYMGMALACNIVSLFVSLFSYILVEMPFNTLRVK